LAIKNKLILGQGIYTLAILLITVGVCLTNKGISIEEQGIIAAGLGVTTIIVAAGVINFAGAPVDKGLEVFFATILSSTAGVITFVVATGLTVGYSFAFLFSSTKGYAVAIACIGFTLSAVIALFNIPIPPPTISFALFKEKKNEIISTILTVIITSAILYWVPRFL